MTTSPKTSVDSPFGAFQDQVRLVIDTIPGFVWSASPDGAIQFLNQRGLDYTGLSLQQIRGWNWKEANILHPEDVQGLFESWNSIVASGEPGEIQARMRRHDGEYRWFLFRVAPLREADGNLVAWWGIDVEIHERKNAETLLEGENNLLEMIATGTDPNPMFGMDIYTTRYHGKVLTHFDALSHMFYQGKMYNGYSQQQVDRQGAQQLAVTAYKNGIVSRGILMDIPRLKGVKYLELSTAIYPSDLDAWEKKAGLKVGPGDIVLVRTGRWARESWSRADGSTDSARRAAGQENRTALAVENLAYVAGSCSSDPVFLLSQARWGRFLDPAQAVLTPAPSKIQ